ncbi:TetR family transcriptional regulator [Mycobacterium sp. CBMA295]|nr:TetR family transcriptional regulator [Mycolicibacterium sp. CBMA 295]
MTAAVTPKGERRRYALVRAAAELLCEGGFDAVRHRAVARRAGLPLASTTYYFSSLDDLIAKAVEYIGTREAEQLRAGVAALSRRRRGAESTADILVDLLLGESLERRGTEELMVERSGRSVRAELVTALVCAVDGAVVASLVDEREGPRASARATLIDVIDVLAPVDDRAVRV